MAGNHCIDCLRVKIYVYMYMHMYNMYYHPINITRMNICFPTKTVTRHTADKPWITDVVRSLVRNRQRAQMSGDFLQEKILRAIRLTVLLRNLNLLFTSQR